PAPTTTEPAPSDGIPESAMLTPDAIVDASPVEWTATAIDALPAVECVPDLPADTVATRSVAFTGPGPQPDPAPGEFTSPVVRHDLLRVEPGTAADVAEGLVSSLAECVP